jgi:hypothetical protein
MLRFAFDGCAITGSVYIKQSLGPTSRHLLGALRELQREKAIRVSSDVYFRYRKATYLPNREPDMSGFSADEIAIVRDVIDFVANQNTAKTISEFSHNRAWEMAEFGAEIPYHTAFALFPSEVSDEAVEWVASVSGEVEAERSKRPAMDHQSFANFRSRV